MRRANETANSKSKPEPTGWDLWMVVVFALVSASLSYIPFNIGWIWFALSWFAVGVLAMIVFHFSPGKDKLTANEWSLVVSWGLLALPVFVRLMNWNDVCFALIFAGMALVIAIAAGYFYLYRGDDSSTGQEKSE